MRTEGSDKGYMSDHHLFKNTTSSSNTKISYFTVSVLGTVVATAQ